MSNKSVKFSVCKVKDTLVVVLHYFLPFFTVVGHNRDHRSLLSNITNSCSIVRNFQTEYKDKRKRVLKHVSRGNDRCIKHVPN